MIKLVHLPEGLRMYKRAKYVKKHGWKKYNGNAEEICRQIINDCWNGAYFQTSAGHFSEFWARDFGFCIESLINLGYKEKIKKTMEYALTNFTKNKKITTTISPSRKIFDFPYYASDSVPFFIRSLRVLNNKNLIEKHSEFLNSEIKKYYNIVFDEKNCAVKKGIHFSSIKDYAKRNCSCYDNTMVAMLNNELKKIKVLENPFKNYNLKKTIKELFWKKTHFIDDLSGYDFITGDANIFPFFSGVFDEKNMLKSAIKKIQEKALDKPFPLRYYHEKIKEHDMISVEIFAKNYERDTIWMHMGPIYINLVKKIDKKKADFYINQYNNIIEKNKNYLEVFNPDGTPFKSAFYHADESMLWSSMFLDLII